MKRLATILAACILAGCADAPPAARLTYETSPAGATLYEDGQSLGIAPVMRRYGEVAADGRIRTAVVTAVWPSGASTTFWTFLKPGDDNVTTLARPAGAPNAQVDLDNALKYESAEARAKAAALRDQAHASERCKAEQHSGGALLDCF